VTKRKTTRETARETARKTTRVRERRHSHAKKSYVPERGDVVWLDVDPHAGREQSKRRPAVVLSPSAYNARTSLALCCPVTSRVKGYPFEVALPAGLEIEGVVLVDQLRSQDWHARHATHIGTLSPATTQQILARARALLA